MSIWSQYLLETYKIQSKQSRSHVKFIHDNDPKHAASLYKLVETIVRPDMNRNIGMRITYLIIITISLE